MIVSNKTRSLLTYVTHVCYLYMILYLDIVIAKFILSLLLLQTLAAFLASFKMLSQGQCLLSHLNKLPQVAICSLSYQFVRDFNSMKAKIEINESCKCHKAKLTWNTTAVGFKARRKKLRYNRQYHDVHKCMCLQPTQKTLATYSHTLYIHDIQCECHHRQVLQLVLKCTYIVKIDHHKIGWPCEESGPIFKISTDLGFVYLKATQKKMAG